MAALSDGTRLVSINLDRLVQVTTTDGSHGAAVHTEPDTVAVTEDGKYAFTGAGDGTIKRWDLETYSEDGHFSLHKDKVNASGAHSRDDPSHLGFEGRQLQAVRLEGWA